MAALHEIIRINYEQLGLNISANLQTRQDPECIAFIKIK